MSSAPTIEEIESVANKIQHHVRRTPTIEYSGAPMPGLEDATVFIKLELLQYGGSFKARGVFNTILSLSDTTNGLTAFSAGNHAIAVAYAANKCGVSAKVVMPRSANPFRVERVKYWGADIMFGDTMDDLISIVEKLQQDEQRVLIHPFEGRHTIEGTATVGYELCMDAGSLDAIIVPIGGGGLIAGVASAVKQLQPAARVIGVEPTGACGMASSIDKGEPLDKVALNSIADSLSAPMHLPMSYSYNKRYVDEFVQVTDEQILNAMRFMFTELKLAVEPACAAAIAALQGPLVNRLAGKRVGLIACGSNIDMQTYNDLLAQ